MAESPPRPLHKPGRPKVDPSDEAPSVYMKVALGAELYDKSFAAARRRRMTVPELIRHALTAATVKDADR